MKISHKKAFTLVEMLIVIVIIGILAAALIPRLTSARGRANDTARKSHLQQVAQALIAYQLDKGHFPNTGGCLSQMSGLLIGAGLASIPMDPDKNVNAGGHYHSTLNPNNFKALGHVLIDNGPSYTSYATCTGEYVYLPLIKDGNRGGGFALLARADTEGGANRVGTPYTRIGNNSPDWSVEIVQSQICTSITKSGSNSDPQFAWNTANSINQRGPNCIYEGGAAGPWLFYVYVY